MLDIDMFMKLAPASVATALASIVFPVPGGPKSKIPLHGWYRIEYKQQKLAFYQLKVVFHCWPSIKKQKYCYYKNIPPCPKTENNQ